MRGVQADQRIEGGSEEVGLEWSGLRRGSGDTTRAPSSARKIAPSSTVPASQAVQRADLPLRSARDRKVNGDAAGEQADGAEDGQLQHLAPASAR